MPALQLDVVHVGSAQTIRIAPRSDAFRINDLVTEGGSEGLRGRRGEPQPHGARPKTRPNDVSISPKRSL